MIPRLVDPWLHIQELFTAALSSEGRFRVEGLGEAREARYFS
jgi:hypothetical protein